MSDFNRLMRLLEQELSLQEKLLDLLGRERAAIVHLKQDQIETIRTKKEEVVIDAQQIGRKRSEIIREIVGGEGPAKLSEVLVRCGSVDTRRKLEHIGTELRSTTQTVQDMNSKNAELIKQSLGLVSATIAIFRSTPGSDLPTYNESGGLRTPEDAGLSGRGTLIRDA